MPGAVWVAHWVRKRQSSRRKTPLQSNLPPTLPVGTAAFVLSAPEWLAYTTGGWTALQSVAPWSGLCALATLVVLNVAGCGWSRGPRSHALRTGLLATAAQGVLLVPVVR